MTSVIDVIKCAKEYVWRHMVERNEFVRARVQPSSTNEEPSVSNMSLNRSLNYMLCGFADRMVSEFGECTRRDVVAFIEHWIAAQGSGPKHPVPWEERIGAR